MACWWGCSARKFFRFRMYCSHNIHSSVSISNSRSKNLWPIMCSAGHLNSTITLRWHRGVAVECRTRDQEVASSSLGRTLRHKNSGQVSHTYVPLSPSSVRLPCDRGADKLWSVCGWQVKNCVIPLLHTGRVWLLVAVLRGSLSLEMLSCATDVGWACVLTVIQAAYYYYYCY